MRILDLNSSYSPKGGGIRVYHQRKLEYFSGNGPHTSALAVPDVEDRSSLTGPERVYHLKSVPLFSSGYRLVVGSGGICSVIQDYRPDIIEVGSPYLLPRLTRTALGDADIPVVGFYHTDFPDSYVRPYAGRIFPPSVAGMLYRLARAHAGRTYRSMTAVFAASRCMLEKLRELGVTRLFHTPLGVDTDRFSPSVRSQDFRRAAGVPEGGILVLYLARFHWEKGLDLLMDSYPLFRDPGRIKLVIGGRGPHRRLVDDFVSRYPEVTRLPYIGSREGVAEAMASADVFLALGQYETFGLGGLEAISCGTVPVFPDRGASAEMAESLGVLPPYRADSAESLAATVEEAVRISREGLSGGEIRRYAVSNHSWTDAFRRIEGFYEMVLDAHRRGETERLDPPGSWWEA